MHRQISLFGLDLDGGRVGDELPTLGAVRLCDYADYVGQR